MFQNGRQWSSCKSKRKRDADDIYGPNFDDDDEADDEYYWRKLYSSSNYGRSGIYRGNHNVRGNGRFPNEAKKTISRWQNFRGKNNFRGRRSLRGRKNDFSENVACSSTEPSTSKTNDKLTKGDKTDTSSLNTNHVHSTNDGKIAVLNNSSKIVGTKEKSLESRLNNSNALKTADSDVKSDKCEGKSSSFGKEAVKCEKTVEQSCQKKEGDGSEMTADKNKEKFKQKTETRDNPEETIDSCDGGSNSCEKKSDSSESIGNGIKKDCCGVHGDSNCTGQKISVASVNCESKTVVRNDANTAIRHNNDDHQPLHSKCSRNSKAEFESNDKRTSMCTLEESNVIAEEISKMHSETVETIEGKDETEEVLIELNHKLKEELASYAETICCQVPALEDLKEFEATQRCTEFDDKQSLKTNINSDINYSDSPAVIEKGLDIHKQNLQTDNTKEGSTDIKLKQEMPEKEELELIMEELNDVMKESMYVTNTPILNQQKKEQTPDASMIKLCASSDVRVPKGSLIKNSKVNNADTDVNRRKRPISDEETPSRSAVDNSGIPYKRSCMKKESTIYDVKVSRKPSPTVGKYGVKEAEKRLVVKIEKLLVNSISSSSTSSCASNETSEEKKDCRGNNSEPNSKLNKQETNSAKTSDVKKSHKRESKNSRHNKHRQGEAKETKKDHVKRRAPGNRKKENHSIGNGIHKDTTRRKSRPSSKKMNSMERSTQKLKNREGLNSQKNNSRSKEVNESFLIKCKPAFLLEEQTRKTINNAIVPSSIHVSEVRKISHLSKKLKCHKSSNNNKCEQVCSKVKGCTKSNVNEGSKRKRKRKLLRRRSIDLGEIHQEKVQKPSRRARSKSSCPIDLGDNFTDFRITRSKSQESNAILNNDITDFKNEPKIFTSTPKTLPQESNITSNIKIEDARKKAKMIPLFSRRVSESDCLSNHRIDNRRMSMDETSTAVNYTSPNSAHVVVIFGQGDDPRLRPRFLTKEKFAKNVARSGFSMKPSNYKFEFEDKGGKLYDKINYVSMQRPELFISPLHDALKFPARTETDETVRTDDIPSKNNGSSRTDLEASVARHSKTISLSAHVDENSSKCSNSYVCSYPSYQCQREKAERGTTFDKRPPNRDDEVSKKKPHNEKFDNLPINAHVQGSKGPKITKDDGDGKMKMKSSQKVTGMTKSFKSKQESAETKSSQKGGLLVTPKMNNEHGRITDSNNSCNLPSNFPPVITIDMLHNDNIDKYFPSKSDSDNNSLSLNVENVTYVVRRNARRELLHETVSVLSKEQFQTVKEANIVRAPEASAKSDMYRGADKILDYDMILHEVLSPESIVIVKQVNSSSTIPQKDSTDIHLSLSPVCSMSAIVSSLRVDNRNTVPNYNVIRSTDTNCSGKNPETPAVRVDVLPRLVTSREAALKISPHVLRLYIYRNERQTFEFVRRRMSPVLVGEKVLEEDWRLFNNCYLKIFQQIGEEIIDYLKGVTIDNFQLVTFLRDVISILHQHGCTSAHEPSILLHIYELLLKFEQIQTSEFLAKFFSEVKSFSQNLLQKKSRESMTRHQNVQVPGNYDPSQQNSVLPNNSLQFQNLHQQMLTNQGRIPALLPLQLTTGRILNGPQETFSNSNQFANVRPRGPQACTQVLYQNTSANVRDFPPQQQPLSTVQNLLLSNTTNLQQQYGYQLPIPQNSTQQYPTYANPERQKIHVNSYLNSPPLINNQFHNASLRNLNQQINHYPQQSYPVSNNYHGIRPGYQYPSQSFMNARCVDNTAPPVISNLPPRRQPTLSSSQVNQTTGVPLQGSSSASPSNNQHLNSMERMLQNKPNNPGRNFVPNTPSIQPLKQNHAINLSRPTPVSTNSCATQKPKEKKHLNSTNVVQRQSTSSATTPSSDQLNKSENLLQRVFPEFEKSRDNFKIRLPLNSPKRTETQQNRSSPTDVRPDPKECASSETEVNVGLTSENDIDDNPNKPEFVNFEDWFNKNKLIIETIDLEEYKFSSDFKESENIVKEENIVEVEVEEIEDIPPRISSVDSGISSPRAEESSNSASNICLCGQRADFICSCRTTVYCSRRCQELDWNSHQGDCKAKNTS